jgi:hypothetical protein
MSFKLLREQKCLKVTIQGNSTSLLKVLHKQKPFPFFSRNIKVQNSTFLDGDFLQKLYNHYMCLLLQTASFLLKMLLIILHGSYLFPTRKTKYLIVWKAYREIFTKNFQKQGQWYVERKQKGILE